MDSKASNKYKVDPSRWYEDNDISNYLEVMINNEYGGYEVNYNYLLKNQFIEEINNQKLNFIIAVTPSITNAPAARHARYHGNNGILPNDVDYYLNKQKQQAPDEGRPDPRKDVFDEIMPGMVCNEISNAKILFPYNKGDRHWCAAEIIIKKNENTYNIDLFLHDPFGGGQIDNSNYKIIINSIEKRIQDSDPAAKFNFSNNRSPYLKRQSDGCSCGVIASEDLLKRIRGESLNVAKPYSYGAIELRERHINKMRDYEANQNALQDFINRNTCSHQSPFSSSHSGYSSSNTLSSNSENASHESSSNIKCNNLNGNSLKYIKYFLSLPILPSLILIAAFELIKNLLPSNDPIKPKVKDCIKEKKFSDEPFSHTSKYARKKSTPSVKVR